MEEKEKKGEIKMKRLLICVLMIMLFAVSLSEGVGGGKFGKAYKGTAPVTVKGNKIGMPEASATQAGYLSKEDFATFDAAGSTETYAVKADVAAATGTLKVSLDAVIISTGAIELNIDTHKANDGSDHSFINQSVANTSTPTFGALKLNGNCTSYQFYDKDGLVVSGGDNLGDHTATEDLDMAGFDIMDVSTITAKEFNISTKYITVSSFSSTGINWAIDALGADGGTAYMPEGEYDINSTITIDVDNISLIGSGNGTYLNASGWSTGHVITLSAQHYLYLANFQIEGNSGGLNSMSLIDDSGTSTNCVFENLWLHDSDDEGIRLNNSSSDNNKIINCLITDCDAMGITCHGDYCIITGNTLLSNGEQGVSATGNHIIITDNLAQSNGDEGIYLTGSGGNTVSNNITISNGDEGIYISGNLTTVDGNVSRDNTSHGIEVDGCDSVVVSNNIVDKNGNGANGIHINSCQLLSIVGNAAEGSAGTQERGIYLVDASSCTITGNATSDHDTCGIEEDSVSCANTIHSNNCISESTPHILAGVDSSYLYSDEGDLYIGADNKVIATSSPTWVAGDTLEYNGSNWVIKSSDSYFCVALASNTEVAVTTDTFRLVDGTYTSNWNSNFTISGTTLTYVGASANTFMINISISASSSINNVVATWRLMKNGVSIEHSSQQRKIAVADDVGSISLNCMGELDTGDKIALSVRGDKNATITHVYTNIVVGQID